MNGFDDTGRAGAPRPGPGRNIWMAALAPVAALASSMSWLLVLLAIHAGHASLLPPGTLVVARVLGHLAVRFVFST